MPRKVILPLPKNHSRWGELAKNLLLYGAVILLGLLIFFSFARPPHVGEAVPFSQALKLTKEGKINKVEVAGDALTLLAKDGTKYLSRKESNESLEKILRDNSIDPTALEIDVKDPEVSANLFDLVISLLPVILMAAFFYFIFRQARGAGDSLFSFGKSRARLFARDGGAPKVTFKDVAGVADAEKELQEVVEFLKEPEKFRKLGARIPKGVLLVGPSGVGKTLLAKALAGEAKVPFFSMAGSEFMEMLVGVGASRVRDLFETAKKAAPAIIFIDEIESIGRQRGSGFTGGHDEREQTLNQILVEMDGFTPNTNVIVVGASVTGDTPVLIRDHQGVTRLFPIEEFANRFFAEGEEGEKVLFGFQALGYEKRLDKRNRNYFGNSAFQTVRGVFRHRVKELFKVEYLGGEIITTGNHSLFVRTQGGLRAKPVSALRKGEVLVDLPLTVNRTQADRRQIRAHKFAESLEASLPVYEENRELREAYEYALVNAGVISQSEIAARVGVSQGAISWWQRGRSVPRALSLSYFKHDLPPRVGVTPSLLRLLGYYVAEGYARKEIDFCLGEKEEEIIADIKLLMRETFGLEVDRERRITPGAINLVYHAKPLAQFFIRLCGKGAKNKHIPNFLFDAPYEFFREFLRGVAEGDGYVDKRGRLTVTSVSQLLITELNWLCRMHGIKSAVGKFSVAAGRRIKGGKPLKETLAYRLYLSKYNNPFNDVPKKKNVNYAKLPIVRRVTRLPFDGFVYDLCGCENEAFFGGKSPLLLHNSNRPDLLDPALIRPGRFDRRVVLDYPDLEGRQAILKIHLRGKPVAAGVNLERLARRTVGFSGADLENMLNEAAILAARLGKKVIEESDLEESATKVKLGPEKKRLQSEKDKLLTAYHEAGHALAAASLPNMDPVHRISIVSRGMALGFTMIPPAVDRYNETKTRLLEQITSLLGGRSAEELVFNELTVGAGSDIAQATVIARRMVTEYGMSELGPISLPEGPGRGLMSGFFGEEGGFSENMAARIDDEVKAIIDQCHARAREILQSQRGKLDLVAKNLVEKETLEGEDFLKLIG